ncbi:6809_t:CDS:2 [Paraglomus brasilianum]|uniref:6809_t:CDS:1 n=1 Tax=Paraglomus brasilianum TaxID=144538 RepID=A0A9N9GDV6_9GLOM|nr:6809_t:CDS:2 [Paraglomus brasilianum]
MNYNDLVVASQEILTSPHQRPPASLYPETDKQLRSRKAKKATSMENLYETNMMSLSHSNESAPALNGIRKESSTFALSSKNSGNKNSGNKREDSGDNISRLGKLDGLNSSSTNSASFTNPNGNPTFSSTPQNHRQERKTYRPSPATSSPPERDYATGPPTEILRDPTSEAFSTHAYSWPIVFAVIPPMGALVYGKSDVWIPWELYYAARSRRVINESNTPSDPQLEEQRAAAAKDLRKQERHALALVVASPILGGYALHFAKMSLTDYDKYITHFNINLFVFAAGIRPLMHIATLAKNKTLHLQEQVHYPSTEVELLKRRVQHLEYEFSQLRRGFATKRDVIQVRDGFEPTLSQLNKAMRRCEKKEACLRTYSDERFAYLEEKLREFDSIITYRLQDDQVASLPNSMMQVMFLPLNITVTILGYARYFLPKSLRGRSAPMLQPPNPSDEDDSNVGHRKLYGEYVQGSEGLQSRDLQKYH